MGAIKLYEAVQKWGQKLKKVINCVNPLALAKDFSLYYFTIQSKETNKWSDDNEKTRIYQKEYNKFPDCPFYEHIKISMKRNESGNRTTFEFNFIFRFDFKKVFEEVEPERGASNLKGGEFVKYFKVFDVLEELIYDSGAFPKSCVIFWDVYYTIWKHDKFEETIDTALTWTNSRLYFDYNGVLQGGNYEAFVKKWDRHVTSYAQKRTNYYINLLNLVAYHESRQAFHEENPHLARIMDDFFLSMLAHPMPPEWSEEDYDPEEGTDLDDLLDEYDFELPEEYIKLLHDLDNALDKQVSKQIYQQIARSGKKIEIKKSLDVVFTKSKMIFSALLDAAANMPILLWALREEMAEQLKSWIVTFITGCVKNSDKLGKSAIARNVDIDYSWVATDTPHKTRKK
jgi:hypothetical protein